VRVDRFSAPQKPSVEPVPTTEGGWFAAWTRFWFRPSDTAALAVLRVLTGTLVQLWILSHTWSVQAFFGLDGWIDQQAYQDLARIPEEQAPGWSLVYLTRDHPALLTVFHWGAGAVSFLFALGVCTRLTGILTWVAVASFTANPTIETDAEVFLVLLTFYMMVAHVLQGLQRPGLSVFERITGGLPQWLSRGKKPEAEGSVGANVGIRLLQVHFAIAVAVGALHKLQMGEWWSGVAFWYHLYPARETTLSMAQEYASRPQAFMAVLSVSAYAVLAWQLAFPFFAWRPRWRWLLVGGGIVGWLGAAFLYKVPLLGPVYFVCCLAYVTAEEWRTWFAWLGRWFARGGEQAGQQAGELVRANPVGATRRT
jgi:hypothetical protein